MRLRLRRKTATVIVNNLRPVKKIAVGIIVLLSDDLTDIRNQYNKIIILFVKKIWIDLEYTGFNVFPVRKLCCQI